MSPYVQLYLWSLGPALIAALANRLVQHKGRSRDSLLVTGFMFGVGGILANTFGIYLTDVDATVCARDAFSIVSAFWFGPLAGSVTTLMVALERAITPLWGVGAASWIRSSAASGVVGIFAVVIGKYLFRGERPALLPAITLSAVAEIIHLAVVFLFGMANISNTLGIVDSALVPMMVVCALSAAFSAVACSSVGSLRANVLSSAGGIAIFYGLAMLGTWGVGFGNARQHTERLLDFAEQDLAFTADEIKHVMLEHDVPLAAAETAYRRLLADWTVGETGYYIFADEGDTCIIVSIPQHRSACGRKLSELGISSAQLEELKRHPSSTVAASVMGERCFVRYREYARHHILVVVPAAEYYGTAMQFAFAAVAILFVVFVVFGYLIGHMVESSRRIAELHALEEAKRESDMHMASSIQLSALPAVYPPFPGERRVDIFAQMTPAREVGGDFYDFYMLDADRLVFLVADVSGKGIPAAMFMMKAKATLESSVKRTSTLSEALAKTNRKLAMGNDSLIFVTCWIGIVDLNSGEVTYVNAGHNPPFVRHADGSLDRLSERSGLPLAAHEGSVYRERKLKLSPHDLLLLYTDGVTEAMNATGEQFFESRLKEVLARTRETDPKLICDRVKAAVDAFAAGNSQSDDITILSLFIP